MKASLLVLLMLVYGAAGLRRDPRGPRTAQARPPRSARSSPTCRGSNSPRPADRPPYCITLETLMAFAARVKAHVAHCPNSDYVAEGGRVGEEARRLRQAVQPIPLQAHALVGRRAAQFSGRGRLPNRCQRTADAGGALADASATNRRFHRAQPHPFDLGGTQADAAAPMAAPAAPSPAVQCCRPSRRCIAPAPDIALDDVELFRRIARFQRASCASCRARSDAPAPAPAAGT